MWPYETKEPIVMVDGMSLTLRKKSTYRGSQFVITLCCHPSLGYECNRFIICSRNWPKVLKINQMIVLNERKLKHLLQNESYY